MFRSLIIVSLILLLSGTQTFLRAQTDISTVNVERLSDAQINQIAKEIQDRGLTVDQATTLAKAKGASQQQIDQLMIRLQQVQTTGSTTSYNFV